MALRLRHLNVALVGASLLTILLAACSGGSSTIPQGAEATSQAAAHQTFGQGATSITSGSALRVIHITDADRIAVASHGPLLRHVSPVASAKTGQAGSRTTPSAVHGSDVQYFGGALLQNAKVYNAYVDSIPSTFGNFAQFETNLSRSSMIHITDEYVHTTANNRYPWGGDVRVDYPAIATLGDNDLLLIIHAVAKGVAGGGYHNLYNIFLPPGINYCDPTGACNASPTVPTVAFCAFHGSVTFNDVGNVVFAFDPYPFAQFCNVDHFAAHPNAPTPNGLQQDIVYNVASHEEFESITDPNPPSGWVNPFPFYSFEIGDLCAYIPGPFVNGVAVPVNSILNGKAYRLQFEYSNKQIGCANTPP